MLSRQIKAAAASQTEVSALKRGLEGRETSDPGGTQEVGDVQGIAVLCWSVLCWSVL